MKDLTNPTWIKIKGALFLLLGLLSAALLLADMPTLRTGLLLILVVWSFCRVYYFSFYVIEKYVGFVLSPLGTVFGGSLLIGKAAAVT